MHNKILHKGKKGVHNVVFSRMTVIILLSVLQVLILFGTFRFLAQYTIYILGGSALLSLGMTLYIMNTRGDPTVKISWLLLIWIAPVAGSLFYIYAKTNLGYRTLQFRLKEVRQSMEGAEWYQASRRELPRTVEQTDPELYHLAAYLEQTGGFSAYPNTEVRYFPSGEEKFEEMLHQLSQAKSFIFLEYFIVEEGYMWDRGMSIS